MKKVFVMFTLACISAGVFSQNAFRGFFKPMPKSFEVTRDYRQSTSVWYFRPVVTLTAVRFDYIHEEGKPFEVSSFSNVGAGISYQHFIGVEGTPYNNYGFSAIVLFNQNPLDTQEAGIAVAGTANLWQYWNVGAGYDFSSKRVFLLTGVTYSFN